MLNSNQNSFTIVAGVAQDCDGDVVADGYVDFISAIEEGDGRKMRINGEKEYLYFIQMDVLDAIEVGISVRQRVVNGEFKSIRNVS